VEKTESEPNQEGDNEDGEETAGDPGLGQVAGTGAISLPIRVDIEEDGEVVIEQLSLTEVGARVVNLEEFIAQVGFA